MTETSCPLEQGVVRARARLRCQLGRRVIAALAPSARAAVPEVEAECACGLLQRRFVPNLCKPFEELLGRVRHEDQLSCRSSLAGRSQAAPSPMSPNTARATIATA